MDLKITKLSDLKRNFKLLPTAVLALCLAVGGAGTYAFAGNAPKGTVPVGRKATDPNVIATKINALPKKKVVKIKKITVAKSTVTMKKGTSMKLSVIISPSKAKGKLKYASSKPKIVSVTSSGKLKAKKPGKAKITISSGKVKKRITVIVTKKKVRATKLSFVKKSLKVKKGSVRFLPYKINAKANDKLTWKSSKKSVVAVDNNGKITAKKKGKAVITVKCGKKKATCKITVK